MKILHVVPTYLPAKRYGGPIYSVHGLCIALAQRGHHVEVYTTNVDGPGVSDVPLQTPVRLDGVEITYFRTGIGRRLYRSPEMGTALACHAHQFDVVHLHSVFLWTTTAGAAAARSAGVPYVLSPRGMLVPELIRNKSRLLKTGWIELFDRRNVAEAASVHVTTELEQIDMQRLRLKAKRMDIIPNGFNLPREAEAALLSAAKSEREEVVILSLGRISWKKGLDRLIPAMAQVSHARLVIAGYDDEGYTPRLERLIAQHGLGERARFLGPVHGAAKWEAFADADIFALASYSENFGIAVLEAMACGVPVVVTPEVGLADVVAQSGAGLVVEGNMFGQALAQLAANPNLRRQMGLSGQKVAKQNYSWSAVAERMDALYREIAHQSGLRRR